VHRRIAEVLLFQGQNDLQIVSQDEQWKYVAKASKLLRDVATIILDIGMWPEEVFTIRKENAHLPHGYRFVPAGETQLARRSIPLTDTMELVSKLGVGAAKGPCIFPSRHDPNKPHTCLKKADAEALRDAKIKSPFQIYDLRHTLSPWSAMAREDLPTLKELMGHSEISTTLRYIHPTPQRKQ
jgi:integrase